METKILPNSKVEMEHLSGSLDRSIKFLGKKL